MRMEVCSVVWALVAAAAGAAEDRNAWQQPERVMDEAGIKPGSRVADVGCGSGYFALRLARAVGEGGTVYAVDINETALNSLKKQAAQQRLNNIVPVVSSAEDARLQPESVDVVFICNVLHDVPVAHREPLLRSAIRSLKPGGVLHLIDWRKSHEVKYDPYEELIPRDDLVRMCSDAGLALEAEFHYLKLQVFLRFSKPAK